MSNDTRIATAIDFDAPAPITLPAECPYYPEWRTLADNASRDVERLKQTERELRAELQRVNDRLVEYRHVNTLATEALERYHALYGPLKGRAE